MKFDLERDATKLFVLLVITDALFILFHVLHIFHTSTGFFYNQNFSLFQERGYAEVFQYTKEFWATFLLLWMTIKASSLLYFSWMLLFGYMLVDDSFGIHEVLGIQIGDTLGGMFGLSPEDAGGLFITAFFGVLIIAAIGVTYRSGDEDEQDFSNYLFLLLLLFILFGGIMSVMEAVSSNRVWQFLLGIGEEGGEMLVMSAMVWYIFQFQLEEEEEPF